MTSCRYGERRSINWTGIQFLICEIFTVNRKLQIFVSSTYTDMLAERQAAVEAILEAGHIPAGMELFAAGDKSQWDVIKRWIDDSDAYMLILGGRYGTIEPDSGKSYTEQEYHYAVQTGKPFFAAVISEARVREKVHKSGPEMMETDHGALLKTFRDQTVTKKQCKFFGDLPTLKLIVFQSLANIARDETLPGWVKGSEVVNPKPLIDESGRLQAELVEARKQVLNLQQQLSSTKRSEADERTTLKLDRDTRDLLISASMFEGEINYQQYLDGGSLWAGEKNFLEPNTPREQARWKSIIARLDQIGLIEETAYESGIFFLTELGYQAIDQIAAVEARDDGLENKATDNADE